MEKEVKSLSTRLADLRKDVEKRFNEVGGQVRKLQGKASETAAIVTDGRPLLAVCGKWLSASRYLDCNPAKTTSLLPKHFFGFCYLVD